jgi:hypothetical protein
MKNNFYTHEDQRIDDLKKESKKTESDARMKSALDDILNEGRDLSKENKKPQAKNCKK